jgi:GT2 family glycosyltransferase
VKVVSVKPDLSVVIPTHNNLAHLQRCLASWRQHAAAQAVELIVVADGCTDGTEAWLQEVQAQAWFDHYLRVVSEPNVHELRCTNRGFREARGSIGLTWQDDMFLECDWMVPEILAGLRRYPEIGLLALSRGFQCRRWDQPITAWGDLFVEERLQATIGNSGWNWWRWQEVDMVIRPWAVRVEALQQVGLLDEAFCPTEWDEADLCFRLRAAGWKTAVHAYERAGAYYHVGSSTISRLPSEKHQAFALRNGKLFHERWDGVIQQEEGRRRSTWWRPGWGRTVGVTLWQMFLHLMKKS